MEDIFKEGLDTPEVESVEFAEVEFVEIKEPLAEEATSDTPDALDPYAALQDRYARSLAEFDNFRKRTLKEKSVAYDNGLHTAIEKILPVLDNFERALAKPENTPFYQGIVMVARQLEGVLTDLGVDKIEGETFDPKLHHAVAHIEDKDYGPGAIVEVLQQGYRHKDKIIRPSMVKVAN